MTKHNDQIFLNRLNQHPQLRERIEALLSVIDNEAGDYYIKPKTNGIKISARFAEKLSIKSSNLIFYNPKF